MTTPAVDKALQIDTPDFSVDENDKNLELWTFRLPVNVPLSALKGLELDLNTKSATFSANDQKFEIRLGDQEENKSFRVLVPHNESENPSESLSTSNLFNDDDDEDDQHERETKKLFNLKASRKGFSRHFTVTATVPKMTETQMAPLVGPTAVDRMRKAYTPVPQRSGLKRRWIPLGVKNPLEKTTARKKKRSAASSSEATADGNGPVASSLASSKRIKRESIGSVNNSDSDEPESSPESKNLGKSERKARKAEKKAAKKAKKEAKKAKKEAKKAKKSKIKNES